jgi:hypothetical protein
VQAVASLQSIAVISKFKAAADGSANKERQRPVVEAGKLLEFHHVYPAFPAFALGDK